MPRALDRFDIPDEFQRTLALGGIVILYVLGLQVVPVDGELQYRLRCISLIGAFETGIAGHHHRPAQALLAGAAVGLPRGHRRVDCVSVDRLPHAVPDPLALRPARDPRIDPCFARLCHLYLLLVTLGGVVLGIFWGAMPGLSTTMAMMLLIGLSVGMKQEVALAFMLGVYTASTFGGAISAVLINIPGTPDSVCTMIEGHPLAKRGLGAQALGLSITSSFIGNWVGILLLGRLHAAHSRHRAAIPLLGDVPAGDDRHLDLRLDDLGHRCRSRAGSPAGSACCSPLSATTPSTACRVSPSVFRRSMTASAMSPS